MATCEMAKFELLVGAGSCRRITNSTFGVRTSTFELPSFLQGDLAHFEVGKYVVPLFR